MGFAIFQFFPHITTFTIINLDQSFRISDPQPLYSFIPTPDIYSYSAAHCTNVYPSFNAPSSWNHDIYNPNQNYNFSYATHNQAFSHAVQKPTYWISMCVMCVASIPKHFPVKCPTEREDFSLIWPSICFKCRPFVPIHDQQNCPNAKAFTSSAQTVDNFHKNIDPEAIKIRRPTSPSKNRKKFRMASDESVRGTTFHPQKTRKTFILKKPTDLSPLPPISSFLQSDDAMENAAESNSTDETGDYTLPMSNRNQTATYTTQLDFNDLEEKQNNRRCVLGPRKVVRKKVSRVKAINIFRSPIDSESLVCKNVDKRNSPVESSIHGSEIINHQHDAKLAYWNDLSSVLSYDNQNGNQDFVKTKGKENLENCAIKKVRTIPKRLTIKSVKMGSDSEVDLYSSNDEEDALASQLMCQKMSTGKPKPCSILKVESPDSLSKKVLSCITPIDKTRMYDLHPFEDTVSKRDEVCVKQSKDRVRRPRKPHQLCKTKNINSSSYSIIDCLQFSPC